MIWQECNWEEPARIRGHCGSGAKPCSRRPHRGETVIGSKTFRLLLCDFHQLPSAFSSAQSTETSHFAVGSMPYSVLTSASFSAHSTETSRFALGNVSSPALSSAFFSAQSTETSRLALWNVSSSALPAFSSAQLTESSRVALERKWASQSVRIICLRCLKKIASSVQPAPFGMSQLYNVSPRESEASPLHQVDPISFDAKLPVLMDFGNSGGSDVR